MDELNALFAPGMRHEQERRRHQEATGEDVGNASDPPSTVDLDRGIAVIRLPRKPPAQPPAEEPPSEGPPSADPPSD